MTTVQRRERYLAAVVVVSVLRLHSRGEDMSGLDVVLDEAEATLLDGEPVAGLMTVARLAELIVYVAASAAKIDGNQLWEIICAGVQGAYRGGRLG